jgi:hypothetical protein
MLEFIVSIIGLFVGGFLAYVSPEEMKTGEKYFRVICYAIVIGLIILGCFSFNWWLFVIGLILGVIFYNEYFYFGIFSVSSLITGNSILTSSLIFVYGLASGSMLYFHKRYLAFVSNLLLFLLPFLLYFLHFNLIALATGGLVGVMIRKIYDWPLTKKQHKA